MAEDFSDNTDRTEEATPERREEFRERGDIAVSKEITSVATLAITALFMTYYLPQLYQDFRRYLIISFQHVGQIEITPRNVLNYSAQTWKTLLLFIVPIFLLTMIVAIFGTFFQTRFNWSWKKVQPDFKRMNPISGMVRMVNMQALVELLKGFGKMFAVGIVSYLILYSEWVKVPGLLSYPIVRAWSYWGEITRILFWSTAGLLFVVAALDYLFNFMSLEKKLKMTKQEVKEEFKKREVDPHVKGRMRKMARDFAMNKMIAATKEATVVVTNPTHFAIAIKYELGMGAPVVVAKGVDFNALRIREVARDFDVPIIENKPLARTLYKIVEVGHEIPESLYKAVSEVIRYVFKLKGRTVRR